MTSSPPRCRGVIVEMLTVLFRWPLLPVRGLIGLAQLLRDQAEREFHDPAAAGRLLEEAAGRETPASCRMRKYPGSSTKPSAA